MTGAASHSLTPSQTRFIQETKARRQRFASKAIPDTPILCLSASARSQSADVPPVVLLEPLPPEPVKEWAERQKEIWFSIVDEIDPPITVRPSIGMVQRICAHYFDFTIATLLSERRFGPVVRARQIAIFLCKEFTTKSLPEIGRKFGDRDHTTILHSIRKISRLESTDEKLLDDLDVLRVKIREAC